MSFCTQSSFAQEINLLHAELCAAIADAKRILILYALYEKNLNVSELADQVGVSQPVASRQLRILRDSGLVYAERQGQSVIYHLADERLVEALNLLRSVLHSRIERRANLLER